MNTNTMNMIFAANEAIKEQESALIEASSINADKVMKNAKARIKQAQAFCKLSESVINLIADYAVKNDVSLELLCDYSNYKTANRIAQRAMYLCNDSALDSRTIQNIKLFDNSLKALDNMFDSFTFDSISSKARITESMLKNILKSAQFFNLIKRNDNASISAIIKSDTSYSLVK